MAQLKLGTNLFIVKFNKEHHMSKIIVANWKMNGSFEFIEEFFQSFESTTNHTLIFCPPFPYISAIKSHGFSLGAQDCSPHTHGAYTGDISAKMIKDIGADYVIVGHSERRHYHGESSQLIKDKATVALDAGLTPIICVGESHQVRQSGSHIQFVIDQLQASLPDHRQNILVAYEPVWAIGTGLTASPDDIGEMHAALRNILPTTPLLYGGSVNQENASVILALDNVEGVLVGGASLKPQELNQIVKS